MTKRRPKPDHSLYVRHCHDCHDLTPHQRTDHGHRWVYECMNCGQQHDRKKENPK